MGKLMIGSFGTLAALAVVNFKLLPRPAAERTFLLRLASLGEAIATRTVILKSVLQPAAIDLLNPEAAAQVGQDGYVLAVQAGGNAAVVERYSRELGDSVRLEGGEQIRFWRRIQNFTGEFLERYSGGAVVRASGTLTEMKAVVECIHAPVIARAGSGVCYGFFERCQDAASWVAEAANRGWKAVLEFSPEAEKNSLDLWPRAGGDFEMMKKVKQMFDPHHLLNRGRLYRRI
jgi:glycolate oxidase FAD binding subunit